MTADTQFDDLMRSGLSTADLAQIALTKCHLDISGTRGVAYTPLWKMISHSREAAKAFYATLPADELRESACEVLAVSGWTAEAVYAQHS